MKPVNTIGIHPTLINATNSRLAYELQEIQRIDPIEFVVKHSPKYNQDGVVVNEERVDVVENLYDVSKFKHLVVVEPEVLDYVNRNHISGYVSYRSSKELPNGIKLIDYLYS